MDTSKSWALLLVSHGSRRASNEEVKVLTRNLAARMRLHFSFITYAFLELADPSIPDGIEACVAAGADRIIILPYFLSAGVHVTKDIPAEIEKKKKKYPQLKIDIADYLGQSGELVKVLSDLAVCQKNAGRDEFDGKQ